MIISKFFIGGIILLMAIGGYSISDYYFLFY
jgi:hypothetical protein